MRHRRLKPAALRWFRFLPPLLAAEPSDVQLITMPGKKWPWRARTSALWLSTAIPDVGADVKALFSSSVLNLAELVALRPDIRDVQKKILYFHENQLVYPVRKSENRERDFQFGYNQILSCLVADQVNTGYRHDEMEWVLILD